MAQTRTSVALCTFNGVRYLREQLQSIAAQTRLPDELIVSDDASTDETCTIIDEFASQACFPVRFLANAERLGPARNFERAMEACDGDIIVFSDQDDVWRPHKVASLLRAFELEPDAAYAFSDAMMVDQSGAPLGQTFWQAVGLAKRIAGFQGAGQVEILLRHNLIPGAAMAFRSTFRRVALPIPEGWMHDYWIVLLGSTLSRGVPLKDVLFDYRRHASQVCGWRKITFTQSLKDSLTIGSQESWKKVELFREVRSRVLEVAGSDPQIADRLKLLEDKEAHLRRRAGARSARGFSRVGRVVSEAWTGRYQRFSDSWYSVIRDL